MIDFAKLNILVVDDDFDVREKVINDLSELGFKGKMVQARDGQEAMDILETMEQVDQNIDIIISDVVMPVKSGVDFLKELRNSDSKFRNVPFLMLTTQSERELIVTCVKLGVNQYLIKPWNKNNLSIKMLELIKKLP